jgi:zinc protease
MRTDRRPHTAIAPLLLGLALWTLAGAALGARLDIQHWETANGARVYFVPAPELPMVDVQIVFDAGSARDDGKPGLARFTNLLLDQGAAGMDADVIAERLEDLGAQMSAEAQRDMAVLELRSLSDARYLDPAIETLAAIVRAPDFPPAALERERGRLITALQAEEQSPGDIAGKAFFAALYGDHPYASHPPGDSDSLQALARADLQDFHRRFYVARNAVVAIVGALDRARAEAVAERLLGALPEGAPAPALPAVPALGEAKRIHIEYPSSQTHVLAGQAGLQRLDEDYFPLYVGNHILGGSGLVSRVSNEIREKRGLAYSAYSYFTPMRVAGPFTLGLQTRNDQAAGALAVLADTLTTFIGEGPGEAELSAAKKNITGGFPLRIASNRSIAGNLAVIGFYGLPLDYLDRFNEQVEAVSREQVRDAFLRRIDPARMVTVTVGQSAQ